MYIANLASIIGVPSSAIVITDIVEEETIVTLAINPASMTEAPSNPTVTNDLERDDNIVTTPQTRVVVKGYRMTFTVTALNTSIIALSSALVASQAPLNAILVDRGYTTVVLGTINAKTFTRPTAQPTSTPSIQPASKKTYPYIIILIVVSTVAIIIAVIAATFYYKPVWKESIFSKCLPSKCCELSSCRSV